MERLQDKILVQLLSFLMPTHLNSCRIVNKKLHNIIEYHGKELYRRKTTIVVDIDKKTIEVYVQRLNRTVGFNLSGNLYTADNVKSCAAYLAKTSYMLTGIIKGAVIPGDLALVDAVANQATHLQLDCNVTQLSVQQVFDHLLTTAAALSLQPPFIDNPNRQKRTNFDESGDSDSDFSDYDSEGSSGRWDDEGGGQHSVFSFIVENQDEEAFWASAGRGELEVDDPVQQVSIDNLRTLINRKDMHKVVLRNANIHTEDIRQMCQDLLFSIASKTFHISHFGLTMGRENVNDVMMRKLGPEKVKLAERKLTQYRPVDGGGEDFETFMEDSPFNMGTRTFHYVHGKRRVRATYKNSTFLISAEIMGEAEMEEERRNIGVTNKSMKRRRQMAGQRKRRHSEEREDDNEGPSRRMRKKSF